jgi:hypothetical protein
MPLLTLFISIICLTYVSSQGSYCVTGVGPSTTLDSNLGAIRLVGESSTISETSDCPGYQGVHEFMTQIADLVPGKQYSLQFSQSTCGGTYPTLAGAWIDFNGDKTFSNAELLAPFSGAKGAITMSFTVPSLDNATAPAKAGSTRMRVQVQETYQTFIDPCGAFNYGGTKDFGITILAGGLDDGKGGISGGTIFLILLLIGGFLYVAIGCGYNKFKKGTVGLKETCPQNEHWWNFCGYVRDGFLFTKSKCSRKGDDIAVYDSIDSNDI